MKRGMMLFLHFLVFVWLCVIIDTLVRPRHYISFVLHIFLFMDLMEIKWWEEEKSKKVICDLYLMTEDI